MIGVQMISLEPVFCLDHKSENKPGREDLLLDRQNLSDHHLIITKANLQLREQNQHLQQNNTWLLEQSSQLNQTSASLTVKNRALTSAIVQLQDQQTRRTSSYDTLLRDHGQLVGYIAALENTSRTASQTISSLLLSASELETQMLHLSNRNILLQEELIHAKHQREDLVQLNSELGVQIENLTARMAEEDTILRGESEKRPAVEDSIIAELQEQNRNLSTLLVGGGRGGETGRPGETESMLTDLLAKEEEYRSLDHYCPVVNTDTNGSCDSSLSECC